MKRRCPLANDLLLPRFILESNVVSATFRALFDYSIVLPDTQDLVIFGVAVASLGTVGDDCPLVA
jgi:hypothetical protein